MCVCVCVCVGVCVRVLVCVCVIMHISCNKRLGYTLINIHIVHV